MQSTHQILRKLIRPGRQGFGTRQILWIVSQQFRALVNRLGMKPIRLHDLRHTFATLAIEDGQDIKAVSETLGHSRIGMTLDTYTHVTSGQRRAIATSVDNIYAKREGA